MKFLKKISVSLAIASFLCSPISVFANGILPEDKEAICTAMEKITEDRVTGHCQFIYSSTLGKPLLKESITYALKLGKYELAERFIKVFGNFYDVNEIDNLGYNVIKTGNKSLYDTLVHAKYKFSTPENCSEYNNLLHAAIASENPEFVDKYLNEGFNPNSEDPYNFYRYPLHICLAKIADITEEYNGHGLEYPNNRARIENLMKIIKLLCEKGAEAYRYAGKFEDQSAYSLLEELNPENEKNCYSKLEFYSEDSIAFCKKIYETIKEYVYKPV